MSFRRLALAAALAIGVVPASAQVISGGGVGGSGFQIISQAYPNTALTGTTSETNQAAIRIPANTLGASGMIRITAMWSCTNDANNKTIGVRFNSTAGAVSGGSLAQTVLTTVASVQGQFIIRNSGATNAQAAIQTLVTPFGSSAGAVNTAAVDTTADSFVNLNGTLAVGTDTLTLLGYTIEVLHQ